MVINKKLKITFLKMVRLPLFISFIITVPFLFWWWSGEQLVQLKLKNPSGTEKIITLPQKDLKRLEYLFSQLFIFDNFAYTLLGNKPLSLGSCCRPLAYFDPDILYIPLLPHNIQMYQAWRTWLKYQDLLTHPNFELWAEESPWIADGVIILLMNKEQTCRVINENKADFQFVLNRTTLNPEELLLEGREKALLKEVLKSHEGLIGTILGYGRDNAWSFFEKRKNDQITTSDVWEENPENLLFIQNKVYEWTRPDNDRDISSILYYPHFAADRGSEESKMLRQDYLLTRKRIIEFYQGQNILEATLSLLHSQPNSPLCSNIFSDIFNLRISPELHAKLSIQAKSLKR